MSAPGAETEDSAAANDAAATAHNAHGLASVFIECSAHKRESLQAFASQDGFGAFAAFSHPRRCILSSPVASFDAQSVDSRPSCEACLCRAECVYDVSCAL